MTPTNTLMLTKRTNRELVADGYTCIWQSSSKAAIRERASQPDGVCVVNTDPARPAPAYGLWFKPNFRDRPNLTIYDVPCMGCGRTGCSQTGECVR